jgi:hypothetical protein
MTSMMLTPTYFRRRGALSCRLRRVRAPPATAVTVGVTGRRAPVIDMIMKLTVSFVVPPELFTAKMSTLPEAGLEPNATFGRLAFSGPMNLPTAPSGRLQ